MGSQRTESRRVTKRICTDQKRQGQADEEAVLLHVRGNAERSRQRKCPRSLASGQPILRRKINSVLTLRSVGPNSGSSLESPGKF